MNNELKIVLKTNSKYALYLYIQGVADQQPTTQFVVAATTSSDVRSGQIVDSWTSGHYFWSFYDADEYYQTVTRKLF